MIPMKVIQNLHLDILISNTVTESTKKQILINEKLSNSIFHPFINVSAGIALIQPFEITFPTFITSFRMFRAMSIIAANVL